MLWTFYVIPHKFDWKRKREKKLKKGEREEEKLFSHLRDESGENVFRGKKVHHNMCVGMQCMDLYEEVYDSA
jgi:hypothetical protein